MTEDIHSGGCQCGAVRYTASLTLDSAHLCHCRMCQKAVGGFFAALVGTDATTFAWTRGAPSTFRSSKDAERGFCAACGTPLFYRDAVGGRIAVTIGSLDRPRDVKPHMQIGAESAMPWFADVPGIHDYGETEANDDPEYLAAVRASNRQHPDHDTQTWPPEEKA